MSNEWAISCNQSLLDCWYSRYRFSEWYQLQFCGVTSLTWLLIVSPGISSGKGFCYYSSLLVVDSSNITSNLKLYNFLFLSNVLIFCFFVLFCVWNRVLEGLHASFMEIVPYKSIVMFTLFQLLYFLICYGVTWIPVGGILFPLPFFFLIALRQYILPKIFDPSHLQVLDSSEYEEMVGATHSSFGINVSTFSFLLLNLIQKKSN